MPGQGDVAEAPVGKARGDLGSVEMDELHPHALCNPRRRRKKRSGLPGLVQSRPRASGEAPRAAQELSPDGRGGERQEKVSDCLGGGKNEWGKVVVSQ